MQIVQVPLEVDVVDNSAHAAGGGAASEWLAANLGGGVVAAGGTGARNSVNDDAQSDDDDDDQASVLEVILGRQVGQREDTACDEDGVDVSVGVEDAVVVVGVHGQSVNLGVGLGVGQVGARGKRRGFSPGAATRHRSRTRVPTDLYYLCYFFSP